MAQGPAIQRGTFTANGSDKNVLLYADVDRVIVENQTEIVATNNGHGFRYTWNIDFGTSMIKEYHPVADHTCAIDTVSDAILPISIFTVRDNLTFTSITAGTNATQPVYNTADTTGLEVGTIVRIYGTDQTNLNGLDFSISSVVTNTSFKLENTLATAPGITAGSNGKYMIVANDAELLSFISSPVLNISNITKASNAVITTLNDHNVKEGLYVKFTVPSVYGMTEIDSLEGFVVSVTNNTITIDIDSSAFTTFKFPIYTDVPFDLATLETLNSTGTVINNDGSIYDINEAKGYVSMILRNGTDKPAGSSGDIINWIAYNAAGEDDEIFEP